MPNLAPIPSLIHAQCDALRTAYAILNKTPHPHEEKAARALINAIEPTLIAILDEEFSNIPEIQHAVYTSGSRLVSEHLSPLTRGRTTLPPTAWETLLDTQSLPYIRFLLDTIVSPANTTFVFLREMMKQSKTGDVAAALLEDTANHYFETNLRLREHTKYLTHSAYPKNIAHYLRTQLSSFSDKWTTSVHYCLEYGNLDLLVTLFMAGHPLPSGFNDHKDSPEHIFLTCIISAHDKLNMMKLLGSDLETLLEHPENTTHVLTLYHQKISLL